MINNSAQKEEIFVKKKKLIAAGTAVLLVAGAAGTAGVYLYRGKAVDSQQPRLPEGMSLSEDVVTATGLTSVGMEEEIWKLDFLEEGLYVEEVYLNVGDQVTADTPVFKVSEESLQTARTELEKAVQETELSRRQGEITYQTGLIDAQQEKELAAIEASYAQSVYDAALQEAQDEVDSLQEQVEEAQELVEEYTASAESNYYYTYYEVGELEEKWKDYAAFLMELYQTWDVEELESTFGGSGGKNGIGYVTNQVSQTSSGSGAETAGGQESSQEAATAQEAGPDTEAAENAWFSEEQSGFGAEAGGAGGPGGSSGGGASVGDDEIRYNIYLAMVEETDEIKALYDTALENYEDAKEKAAAGMAEAKSELAVLQAQLEEQKIAYEQSALEAKQTYELAVTDNENAQMVYESAVKQLEEELAALQDEEETAADNLALFEETIGDGYFYTGEDGTVVMNQVRADNWLTERTPVIAYSNPSSVSVSASVDQEDIAAVSIGQEVYVVVSGYGSFSGTVVSFDPVSASGSASSVNYTVEVELEDGADQLESNLTAYVYLGLSEEEKEQLEGQMQAPGEGTAQEGQMQAPGEGTAQEGQMQAPGEGTAQEGQMQTPEAGNMPEGRSGDSPEGAPEKLPGEDGGNAE